MDHKPEERTEDKRGSRQESRTHPFGEAALRGGKRLVDGLLSGQHLQQHHPKSIHVGLLSQPLTLVVLGVKVACKGRIIKFTGWSSCALHSNFQSGAPSQSRAATLPNRSALDNQKSGSTLVRSLSKGLRTFLSDRPAHCLRRLLAKTYENTSSAHAPRDKYKAKALAKPHSGYAARGRRTWCPPHERRRRGLRRVRERGLGKPEVGHLGVPVLVEQNVGALDVPASTWNSSQRPTPVLFLSLSSLQSGIT